MSTSTTALMRALRQASTPPEASRAMDAVADRLISTSSLSETQQLALALQAAETADVLKRLQQAAAICQEPAAKAQYLGFTLLQFTLQLAKTSSCEWDNAVRKQLLEVYDANHGALSGFIAALLGRNGSLMNFKADDEEAEKTLLLVTPLLKSVLISSEEDGLKATVLDALNRIAWHFDGEGSKVRTRVARLLVEALELMPRLQTQQSTYAVHVALVVDLLTPMDGSKAIVDLAARTARFVLETTQFLLQKDVGVIALLQSMTQLAEVLPEALWDSTFLTCCAYFLADKCTTPLEQQLMLQMLTHTLRFGQHDLDGKSVARHVFVEILVLPLACLISVHGDVVSDLLKILVDIKSIHKFGPQLPSQDVVAPTETAIHAQSIVRLVGHQECCQGWLNSLFQDEASDPVTQKKGGSNDRWLALILVALLADDRPSFRNSAAKCLERQVTNVSKFWGAETVKALVASMVFLISQRTKTTPTQQFAEWMTSCLHSLSALAATTTETMRIVLRLIDSMNNTPKMRSMALNLMYEVWRGESRVFPRLETMLLEPTDVDQDIERHLVKMATIKSLCEKDAELGVQFISTIQVFLEDGLETVVAMAMDAIAALCAGDCLDFYVAFKIIAQKMRKNKIASADEPLFQERLCFFYRLGGAEAAANEKHALKLLDQTWELADSEIASVRAAAYVAMNNFPLDMLGLSVPEDNAELDSDDEDKVTEEEVEEQLDDLMRRLQNEQDAVVRAEIQTLVARVLEHESKKITAGVGRGQRTASAVSNPVDMKQSIQSVVSAAATKEMKALLPSRSEVLALYERSSFSDWSGFLLAYRPKAVIDMQNVKRKDKLVRLATQNLDEVVDTIQTILQHMELPWTSEVSTNTDENCDMFLRIQLLMEGWNGFMTTYVASLEELADLKTPVGVDDADVAFRVFSEGAADLTSSLLNDTRNNLGGALAAGALAGRLSTSRHWCNPQLQDSHAGTVGELSRRLALSMEQARVFSGGDRNSRLSCINVAVALQLSLGQRRIDASERSSDFVSLLQNVQRMLTELAQNVSDDLLCACGLLGLSRVANVYMFTEELETFEVAEWRQQQVKPLAETMLSAFLRGGIERPHSSGSSVGAAIFSHFESTEAVEKTTTGYDRSESVSALRWGSLIGLSRLVMGLPSIRGLNWLKNMRSFFSSLWETNEALFIAVVLGPLLLQCVKFNLLPSSVLEDFVSTCTERSSVSSVDSNFCIVAATHVLCHLESLGGFPAIVQNHTKILVECLTAKSRVGQGLVLAGVANMFGLSFGVTGSFISGTAFIKGDGREVGFDTEIVAALVKVLRRETAEDKAHRGVSTAVLGAIANSADGLYVTQKKKSFDVEVRSLPSTSLLTKTFEWLRQADGSESIRTASSLLACLTRASSVLPLLDYSSLTLRVLVRLCSDDVTSACIRFAVTQGTCDELYAGKLFSPEWFGGVSITIQTELINGVAQAATRLPTNTLQTLLITVFSVLTDIWRRDVSSSTSALLFDSWTNMLRDILHHKEGRAIPESSTKMANQLVIDMFVAELPFDLSASVFVRTFATRVLSKVDYGERSVPVADTFLVPTTTSKSMWSWWRKTVFVVELVRLNVLVITKREASLLFQWVLRHDFVEWTDEKDVNTYLYPLVAQVGAVIATHTRAGEITSALLDVVDVFSRSLSSSTDQSPSDAFKRRALFNLLACVLTWKLKLNHEQYLSTTERPESSDMDITHDLFPFGLVAILQRAKTVSPVGESLWALLQQLWSESTRASETGDLATFVSALQFCSRQMYAEADVWPMPSMMQSAIREFWSVGSTQSAP